MKKLLRVVGACLVVGLSSAAYGQLSMDIAAYGLSKNLNAPVAINLEAPPAKALQQAELADKENGAIPKFAYIVSTNYSPENSGEWTDLPDGSRLWRLKIDAPNAFALNLLFKNFHLTKGATLHAYTPDGSKVLGAFGAWNNADDGYFATENLPGSQLVLELREPVEPRQPSTLVVEGVGYAFVDIFAREEATKAADYCQVDVNCSEGANWQDEKRGVVRIQVREGFFQGWCTGSVVNNTAQDCTPYVLTALHCGENASTANMNQWVFYFNYERSGCDAGTSSTAQSLTGCIRRADSNDGGGNNGSDFLLVELQDDIPASYNTYYNGWNATGNVTSSGVSIHHPDADRKKISTYTSAPVSTTWGGPTGSHWRVNWVATANGHGVTEGGSSGSPLFNSNGQIIGTLTGGSSFCNTPNRPDKYGKMSYHFDNNPNIASQKLRAWLDPTDSGVDVLNGSYAPCASAVAGCTDPAATNYNPNATVDDGSCSYACSDESITINFTFDCWASELSWTLSDGSTTVASGGNYSNSSPDGNSATENICLPAGCYTLTVNDSYGDGMAGAQYNGCNVNGTFNVVDSDGNVLLAMDNANYGNQFVGSFCTDGPVETEVCATPTDLQAAPQSVNSALLTWTPAPDAQKYRIAYRVAGGQWQTFLVNNGSASSTVLNNLSCNTNYQAVIRARCGGQWQPWSAVTSFGTPTCSGLAVAEPAEMQHLELAPNPATDQTWLSVSSDRAQWVNLSVFNVSGQRIAQQQISLAQGQNQHLLSTSDWTPGIYLIQVQNGNFSLSKRLVVR